MSFHATLMGCNVLAVEKLGVRYAMVCAWTTMVDFDKLMMLVGSQSVTGKAINVGDKVGVSALAKGQDKICVALGSSHSDEEDKFIGIPYENDHGIITINGAKTRMKCEVLDIREFNDEGDLLVTLQIDSYLDDEKKAFLALDEVLRD